MKFVYLFIGGTNCKTAFQSLEGADHQPEFKKKPKQNQTVSHFPS